MTFKRYFLLFLSGLLFLTVTGCKNQSAAGSDQAGTVYATTPDEEFFGEPELILRATVDIKKEYSTNPEQDFEKKTAQVTVYNLTIYEVYKGYLGNEPPSIFPIKIYNTSVDPFYLEQGKEYILGLSFLKEVYDEYQDGGGYVITDVRRWSFLKKENGMYENFDREGDHKELDIATLKEKISALYQYEPEKQPVVPLYTVDESIKDPAITEAQREQFFDFVQKWRVDAMTEFTLNQPMQLEFFKYYCAYFVEEDEKTYVDMGVNYPGAAIERIAKWFGTTYNLKDDEPVFLKADELRDLPLAELIQYKEEKVDGKTLVTARCVQYDFPDYRYVDWADVPEMDSYAGHKQMILAGNVTSGYESYYIFDFSFYTEDGKTPTRFVSFAGYSPESIEDGYQTLPEFVPAKNAEPEKTEPTPEKPVETTPETEPEKEPEATPDEEPEADPLPEATVVLDENPKLEKLADGVYFYGIQDFYPTIFYERIDFRKYLQENPQAVDSLFFQCQQDLAKELCKQTSIIALRHGDGSTTDQETYIYPDHQIIKTYPSCYNYKEPDVFQEPIVCITTPNTDWNVIFEQLLLMEIPEDATILRATSSGAVREPGEKIFYYGIWRFCPTIDGEQVDFEKFLETDPQAVEKLLNQAKEDAKKELCTKAQNYDGGTTWYLYEDYSIVKFHASIPDIENPDNHEYLEGLVIGPPEMEYNAVYDFLMRDLTSKL